MPEAKIGTEEEAEVSSSPGREVEADTETRNSGSATGMTHQTAIGSMDKERIGVLEDTRTTLFYTGAPSRTEWPRWSE